ncbi:hypothetical protein DOZ80_30935 [Pseudomonas fluorescens]|uniref:Uncharacterized protein n=1 Tax=Pseudomonas fluorescens TaxID=294 RepID=A0A327MIS8_PSEFL|nr:hypothetical protein DOZ80_30935 [Pseudomonas fluorescens]
MVVNDNAGYLNARVDWASIASKLAPTVGGVFQAKKSPTQWSGFFIPEAVLIWHGLCRNRLRGYQSRSYRRY